MRSLTAGWTLLILLTGCSGSSQGPATSPHADDSPPANQPPSSDSVDCALTADNRAMLTAVNNARADARGCGDTRYPAAPALTWSCNLAQAAASHSTDMATHNFLSHTGSDGLEVSDRAAAAGYRWQSIGENIAAGHASVDAVMQSWLQSSGHCANIMNPAFVDFGAASATDSDSDYRIYWTQVFGRPR